MSLIFYLVDRLIESCQLDKSVILEHKSSPLKSFQKDVRIGQFVRAEFYTDFLVNLINFTDANFQHDSVKRQNSVNGFKTGYVSFRFLESIAAQILLTQGEEGKKEGYVQHWNSESIFKMSSFFFCRITEHLKKTTEGPVMLEDLLSLDPETVSKILEKETTLKEGDILFFISKHFTVRKFHLINLICILFFILCNEDAQRFVFKENTWSKSKQLFAPKQSEIAHFLLTLELAFTYYFDVKSLDDIMFWRKFGENDNNNNNEDGDEDDDDDVGGLLSIISNISLRFSFDDKEHETEMATRNQENRKDDVANKKERIKETKITISIPNIHKMKVDLEKEKIRSTFGMEDNFCFINDKELLIFIKLTNGIMSMSPEAAILQTIKLRTEEYNVCRGGIVGILNDDEASTDSNEEEDISSTTPLNTLLHKSETDLGITRTLNLKRKKNVPNEDNEILVINII